MNARTPLMAGNWKMNLDHHEAIALVQKLAWVLKDAKLDYDDVAVAVIPPATRAFAARSTRACRSTCPRT